MKPYLTNEYANSKVWDNDWSVHVVTIPFGKIVREPLVEANEKAFGIEMPYFNNTIGHRLNRSFHDSLSILFTMRTKYVIRKMLWK